MRMEPSSDIRGKFLNVIDIDPGDLEVILRQCDQKLDVGMKAIIRGLKAIKPTVSG